MKITQQAVVLLLFTALFTSRLSAQETTLSWLQRKQFQTEVNGNYVDLFTLTNKNGMEVCITNYGGRVVSIMAPDKNGKMEDVVCGFPSIQDYMELRQNFGAAIGRYIGRILNARFTLDSIEYKLSGTKHCSHGGYPGFADRVWSPRQEDPQTLYLYYLSPDGENGFPGNLNVCLIYKLTDDNALDIVYEATTDKPTVVNLSHHSFFNISGNLNSSIENEYLQIDSDYITEYDENKCVTGAFLPVKDTPFDFNEPILIGENIDAEDEQLKVTKGYDHTWVLNTNGDDTAMAIRLTDPNSGRTLEVYTTEPGIQVYTANGLNGKTIGKNGITYPRRGAICFEAMHFSDSPNKPNFPSTVLRPGNTYYTHTVYKFGTIK